MAIKNKLLNKTYNFLHNKKNKIKFRSILFMGFLIGLNTYAWFIYITTVDSNVSAKVVGWDITFMDDDEVIENVSIGVNDMYPGMTPFIKEFNIQNRSDLSAHFEYTIYSFKLFGVEFSALNGDYDMEDINDILKDEFPFTVYFNGSGTEMETNEQLNFSINVNWLYTSDTAYYPVTKYYTYASDLTYYVLRDGVYYEVSDVTSTSFDNYVQTGLYLDKDSADTYWGEKSTMYKQTNPDEPSISIEMSLKVKQSES